MGIRLTQALLVLACPGVAAAAFTLTPGHYYATTSTGFDFGIREYDAAGNVVGLGISPDVVRGLAFGDDGLLYAVGIPSGRPGFTVNAIDAAGVVRHTYTGNDYYGGNIGFGHVAVDHGFLYVSGAGHLTRFDTANPAAPGQIIYSAGELFDLDVLPSGNLLVATAGSVDEVTPGGAGVRTIPYRGFSDVRGVAYDPTANAVFVSQLDPAAGLLKFDFTTGQLLSSTMTTSLDLFRSADGHLLLGSNSFTAGPRLYDTDLQPLSTFGGDYRVFVTQYLPARVHLLAGDADGDGRVAFSDLLILAQHYGGPGDFSTGDFNDDHSVGFDDLLILAQNYGQSVPIPTGAAAAAPAATVPEPTAAVTFVGACFWLCRRRALLGAQSVVVVTAWKPRQHPVSLTRAVDGKRGAIASARLVG